jgi:hypothetical protein
MFHEILTKYCRSHTESIAIEILEISFFEGSEVSWRAVHILVFRRVVDVYGCKVTRCLRFW